MKFPIKKYVSVDQYKNDYFKSFKTSFESIKSNKLEEIINILDKVYKSKGNKIIVCGNGGSTALANHFACDHQKLLSGIGPLKPFVVSLSSIQH